MGPYYFLAIIVLALVFVTDRQSLSFDPAKYTRFLKVILLGAALGTLARYLHGSFPTSASHSLSTILMVGWEDVLFSLLPIYYGIKFLPRHISTIITVLASLAFGASHLYIGPEWALVTCFYPYFFAYKIGAKFGYGTVIATHVTYDLVVVAAQALLVATV